MQNPLPEQVAYLALNTFDGLPLRCKPRNLANGSREWTPLSAIILVNHAAEQLPHLKIVSLGTGTKSIPVSALPKCNGLILHDCHAEILALRGFNYWLLCEMKRAITQDYDSPWLDMNTRTGSKTKPFRIKADVEIWMFSTEAPCGDASMELLIAAAEAAGADISPWTTPQVPSSNRSHENGSTLPPGRGGFSELGALRRKPARADAEVSMSMSCTDKLMMKQFTSLLSFPADLFVERDPQSFLRNLVVYEDQFSAAGYRRAFAETGRLKDVMATQDRPSSCESNFFEVAVLRKSFRRFAFEKVRASSKQTSKSKVTNISTVWVAGDPGKADASIVEVLVNGVKQGYKQFDEKQRKGSVICKHNMLQKARTINKVLKKHSLEAAAIDGFGNGKYSDLKALEDRQDRKAVKAWVLEQLGGWPKVDGDDFDVDLMNSDQKAISSYLFRKVS